MTFDSPNLHSDFGFLFARSLRSSFELNFWPRKKKSFHMMLRGASTVNCASAALSSATPTPMHGNDDGGPISNVLERL